MTYDPDLIDRLVREAREDDARMTDSPLLALQEDDETGEYYEIVDNRGFGVIDSMSEWDAIGFARTRNNLAAMADQLEAARREVDLMRRVVEAAEQWRDDRPPAGVYLIACIDAYRAAKGNRP